MLKKILRILGIIVGVLVGLLILGAVFVYFRSEAILNETYTTPALPEIVIANDASVLARGQHLAEAISVCVECHGEDFGGGIVVDDPALGRIVAPNLTMGEGARGSVLSDEDMMRVLRYGVKSDGTSLKVMPAEDYTHLTDADMAALIAYVRSLQPVVNGQPEMVLRPLGRTLLALGQLDIMIAPRIDFAEAGSPPQTAEISLEYGTYLANIAGCTGCHGPGLSGGPIPGAPPDWPVAMNLTPSGEVAAWSEEDFLNTIRTGVTPGGHQLLSEMPWQSYRNMSDEELKAIWLFIQSVPPKPFGNR